jgi:hypothetical protein
LACALLTILQCCRDTHGIAVVHCTLAHWYDSNAPLERRGVLCPRSTHTGQSRGTTVMHPWNLAVSSSPSLEPCRPPPRMRTVDPSGLSTCTADPRWSSTSVACRSASAAHAMRCHVVLFCGACQARTKRAPLAQFGSTFAGSTSSRAASRRNLVRQLQRRREVHPGAALAHSGLRDPERARVQHQPQHLPQHHLWALCEPCDLV